MRRRSKLDFEVLFDRGNEIAHQFGLRHTLPDDLRAVYRHYDIDLERLNGDDSWTLPMPARYVIDRAGRIHAADINPDYTLRPEPSDTLSLLKRIR